MYKDMTLEQIKALCDLHRDEEAIFSVGTMKFVLDQIDKVICEKEYYRGFRAGVVEVTRKE